MLVIWISILWKVTKSNKLLRIYSSIGAMKVCYCSFFCFGAAGMVFTGFIPGGPGKFEQRFAGAVQCSTLQSCRYHKGMWFQFSIKRLRMRVFRAFSTGSAQNCDLHGQAASLQTLS